MYDAVTNNLVIREWLNGSLFPLSCNLALVLAVYVMQSYYEYDRSVTRMRSANEVRVACGLFWVFLADAIRAGWVFLILRFTNDVGTVPEWVRQWSNYSLIGAASVLCAAILWCTYLISPPRWKPWFWKFSLLTTVAFVIINHLVPATIGN